MECISFMVEQSQCTLRWSRVTGDLILQVLHGTHAQASHHPSADATQIVDAGVMYSAHSSMAAQPTCMLMYLKAVRPALHPGCPAFLIREQIPSPCRVRWFQNTSVQLRGFPESSWESRAAFSSRRQRARSAWAGPVHSSQLRHPQFS